MPRRRRRQTRGGGRRDRRGAGPDARRTDKHGPDRRARQALRRAPAPQGRLRELQEAHDHRPSRTRERAADRLEQLLPVFDASDRRGPTTWAESGDPHDVVRVPARRRASRPWWEGRCSTPDARSGDARPGEAESVVTRACAPAILDGRCVAGWSYGPRASRGRAAGADPPARPDQESGRSARQWRHSANGSRRTTTRRSASLRARPPRTSPRPTASWPASCNPTPTPAMQR